MGRTRGYSSLGLDFQGMTWADTFVATNVCYDFAQIGFADNNYLIDPQLGAVIAKVTADGLWRLRGRTQQTSLTRVYASA